MWELFVNLRRRGSLAVHRVHCPLSGLEAGATKGLHFPISGSGWFARSIVTRRGGREGQKIRTELQIHFLSLSPFALKERRISSPLSKEAF